MNRVRVVSRYVALLIFSVLLKRNTTADYKQDNDDVSNNTNDGDVKKVRILTVLTNDNDDSSEICLTRESTLFLPVWT